MRAGDFRVGMAMMIALGAACTDTLPGTPRLISVSPGDGPSLVPTTIVIRGDNIAIGVRTNFDDPAASKVDNAAVVRLGEFDLVDARVISSEEIAATVQPGLPLGFYPLLVIDGLGRAARLADAYVVRETSCSDVEASGGDCGTCNDIPGCLCDAERRCQPLCGDGTVVSPEECDDENTLDGDGCDATCAVEPGYACEREPSDCFASCGDGLRAVIESCDDGNNMSGDGCAVACAIEAGYTCTGELGAISVCMSSCGDGSLSALEECDDGNNDPGDGCTTACAVEAGYICAIPDLPCTTICGDGLLRGLEGCDDDNQGDGDGCSALCAIEEGFICPNPGGPCSTICGDARRAGNEACDDSNTDDGDGCSSACVLEEGWECFVAGSACTEVCPDGLLVGLEDCDDGDLEDNDGCSSTCRRELGFECLTIGEACTPVCGDSRRVVGEGCDDGNTDPDDGCTSTCTLETGYNCPVEGQRCVPACGDGRVIGTESCDDANINASDGCSPLCEIEFGYLCPDQGGICVADCGDGIVIGTESCDDSNEVANDGCSSACAQENGWSCPLTGGACVTRCGDGILTVAEACDDGNNLSNDGCSGACVRDVGWLCPTPGLSCRTDCGDGLRIDPFEACDDDNNLTGDGCDDICRLELGWECPTPGAACTPDCGDGRIIGDEECDDGNTIDADGCDDDCRYTCGNGQIDPGFGEECDDGNRIDADTCEANCTLPSCGNSILDIGEECDDGNTIDSDTCEGNCTLPRCGNQILDGIEECDDGNNIPGDGCENDCTRSPTCVDGIQNGTETGVDCGGTCPTPCIIIGFPLRGAQVVPDSLSVARGECRISVAGSRGSFILDCTHDVADATTISIESGAVGTNGTQVFGLGSGTSPISVTRPLTTAQLNDLTAGNWYVRLDSMARPTGDLRGQIATFTRFPLLPRMVVPPLVLNFNGSCSSWLSPDGVNLTLSCSHNSVATAARIHRAAAGVNGPALHDLGTGTSPLSTTITLGTGEAADFLSGGLYLSVETAANPAGELRGQIARLVESRGAGEQVIPASTSTARMSCRSLISPDLTRWNLRCEHDLADVTAAEVRRGSGGNNGAVAFDLGTGASPIDATLTLAEQDAAELIAGELYVELRSPTFPAGALRAQVATNYSFPIDGRQHIPERATIRSGHCLGHLNPGESTLRFQCVHDVTDATIAHMHRCSASCSGLIWTPNFPSPFSPFAHTISLTVSDVADLFLGNFYMHIHSDTFLNQGELRGQIADVFDFPLEAAQVVPPTASTAGGQCFGFLGGLEVPSFTLRCNHNVANPTAMELRLGASGANGALLQTPSATGVSPVNFTTNLGTQTANDVRAGACYLEVRSTDFPTGEIRGQIVP